MWASVWIMFVLLSGLEKACIQEISRDSGQKLTNIRGKSIETVFKIALYSPCWLVGRHHHKLFCLQKPSIKLKTGVDHNHIHWHPHIIITITITITNDVEWLNHHCRHLWCTERLITGHTSHVLYATAFLGMSDAEASMLNWHCRIPCLSKPWWLGDKA